MMDSLEGILANREKNHLKMNSYRKAILSLSVAWKEFDEHLDSGKKCLEVCLSDFKEQQKKLEMDRESLAGSNRVLEEVRESVELHLEELECKLKELNMIAEQIAANRIWILERKGEFDLQEERLSEQKMSMEILLGKLETERRDLVNIEKSIGEKMKEITKKEGYCAKRFKELQLIERRVKEVSLREERVEQREERLKKMETYIEERFEGLENELQHRFNELDLIQDSLDKQANELLSRVKPTKHKIVETYNEERCKELETQVRDLTKELDSLRNLMQNQEIDLFLREVLVEHREETLKVMKGVAIEVEDRFTELDPAKDPIKRQADELISREEQIEQRVDQLKEMRKVDEERTERRFELEIKLQNRSSELDLMQDSIDGLAKDLKLKEEQVERRRKELVSKEKQVQRREAQLNTTQKCNEECREERSGVSLVKDMLATALHSEGQVIVPLDGRKLLVYLNQQINNYRSLSNEVYEVLQLSSDPAKLVLESIEGFYTPHLKEGDVEFETSVVGKSCILLLEQLMKLSPLICPRVKKEALRLAREWKVTMRVLPRDPSLVLTFIQLFVSYNLLSEFEGDEVLELLELVPRHKQSSKPCRILGLQKYVSDLIGNLIKERQYLVAVRYIMSDGLVDKFSPVLLLFNHLMMSNRIKNRSPGENYSCTEKDNAIDDTLVSVRSVISCIVNYKIECGNLCSTLEECIKKLQKQKNQKGTKLTAGDSFVSPIAASNHPKGAESDFDSSTHILASIFVNMDGKNLLLFLSKHVSEHQLMCEAVSAALHMSPDSGKVVLQAMRWFYFSVIQKGEIDSDERIVRSCNFLLDTLRRLSPCIKPKLKEKTRKLAVALKAYIVRDATNLPVTLGFLLLVGTYGLTSFFNPDDLLRLSKTIIPYGWDPELFHALGILERMPENLPFNQLDDEDPCPTRSALDPAKLVLDAMESCYYSKLGKGESHKSVVMGKFSVLLNQLLKYPSEVSAGVKGQALRLAVDWNEKLNHQDPIESLCFLMFLSVYQVCSSFNRDELVGLLEIVYKYTEAVQIFRLLGLTDKVSEFIWRLVKKGLHLDAVKYVCAFELSDDFPPATLLNCYINHEEEAAKKICEEGNYSIKSWDCALEKILKAFQAAINCIRSHKLESQYPLDDLEARAEQYELLCINQGSSVISTLCKTETNRKRKWSVPEHTIYVPTHKEEDLGGENRRARSL